MSKLHQGLVIKGKICPFKDDCAVKIMGCPCCIQVYHKDYSCAIARYHDEFDKYTNKKKGAKYG